MQSITEAAQAMGRRWTVVALVGLQDGAWPNTRLRTRSLRADLLADIAEWRADTFLATCERSEAASPVKGTITRVRPPIVSDMQSGFAEASAEKRLMPDGLNA